MLLNDTDYSDHFFKVNRSLQNSERSEGHERSECLMSTIIFLYFIYREK
ncbi:hypothetical protein [Enterobacter phage vB_EcRAM-01]|nr:hypothetical protein [Enterobacter phage vB_EcRAM-01]